MSLIDYCHRSRGVPETRRPRKQIERIQRLPSTQQRFVMQMLDTIIAQASG